jgi:hypothetical protein
MNRNWSIWWEGDVGQDAAGLARVRKNHAAVSGR